MNYRLNIKMSGSNEDDKIIIESLDESKYQEFLKCVKEKVIPIEDG